MADGGVLLAAHKVTSFFAGDGAGVGRWAKRNVAALAQAFEHSTRADDRAQLALALDVAWFSRRDHGDALDALCARVGDDVSSTMALRLLTARARARYLRGHVEAARPLVAPTLALLERVDDKDARSDARAVVSAVHRAARDRGCATATALDALDEARGHGPGGGALARALLHVGSAHLVWSEIDEAHDAYRAALAQARAHGAARIEALCLANLSSVHRVRGEHALAAERAQAALTLLVRLGDRLLGDKVALLLARSRGLPSDEVRQSFMRRARHSGDAELLVEVLELEVEVQNARGETDLAAAYADDASALAGALGLCGGARLCLPAHVDADGGAFVVAGKRVDLSQRVALKGIVRSLAQGGVRGTDDLIAAGWPGARLVGDSGPVRLYQALSTLRRLGLEPHIARRDGGYVLVDVAVR